MMFRSQRYPRADGRCAHCRTDKTGRSHDNVAILAVTVLPGVRINARTPAPTDDINVILWVAAQCRPYLRLYITNYIEHTSQMKDNEKQSKREEMGEDRHPGARQLTATRVALKSEGYMFFSWGHKYSLRLKRG